jgi:hypothetical protein
MDEMRHFVWQIILSQDRVQFFYDILVACIHMKEHVVIEDIFEKVEDSAVEQRTCDNCTVGRPPDL